MMIFRFGLGNDGNKYDNLLHIITRLIGPRPYIEVENIKETVNCLKRATTFGQATHTHTHALWAMPERKRLFREMFP